MARNMGELLLVYALLAVAGGSADELPVTWFRMPFQQSYYLWKVIGFSGLAVFQARWIVQWLHSEKHQESRMPLAFWWLSLIGSFLELCYFLRQQDSVGIAGYLFSVVPYSRNLVLIYRKQRLDAARGFAPGPMERKTPGDGD